MIRVNGVPLDNPALGWLFRTGSEPYSEIESELTQVQVAGRDGHVPTSSTVLSPFWPLQVNTPPSGWEALQALFKSSPLVLTKDDRAGVEVSCRLASSTIDRVYHLNEWVDATFIVELTGAYWRDKLVSTVSAPLSATSVQVKPFPGISAPVSDAVIRVKGAATGIRVTDASGAWVSLPNVTGAQYVRFEADTGRAFTTTTDVWTGGTEVSGQVDFGGPRGVFEITPVLAVLDPSTREGVLTVTTATRTGAVVDVRGKAAYAL